MQSVAREPDDWDDIGAAMSEMDSCVYMAMEARLDGTLETVNTRIFLTCRTLWNCRWCGQSTWEAYEKYLASTMYHLVIPIVYMQASYHHARLGACG
jgi:hypothetical protein